MNIQILKNIHSVLSDSKRKLVSSDYNTWETNFLNNHKVQENVHGYLARYRFTNSSFDLLLSVINRLS